MDNFTGITSTEFLNLFLTVIAVEEGIWINRVNIGMQINEMKFDAIISKYFGEHAVSSTI